MSTQHRKPVPYLSKESRTVSRRQPNLNLEQVHRQLEEGHQEFLKRPIHPALVKKPPQK